VNITLPGLASLSPDDIVAIRQGDAFEEWRNTLKMGLQRASVLPSDLLDLDASERAVVMETVKPAYEKLKEEFRKSPFLRNIGSASTPLLCGAVGGLAGYLVDKSAGPLVGALTGSFAQAAAEIVEQWAEEKKKSPRKTQAAAIMHYVALLG
jgi:hypothetical protein